MKEDILFIMGGIPVSLGVTFSALIIGFVLALFMVVGLIYKEKKNPLAYLIKALVVFLTGTPLFIQIFLVYYAPKQFAFLRGTYFDDAWFCAVFALSLNSAAYTVQLFHGAIVNIAPGLWQATAALGLKRFQVLKMMLSLALRRALPSYSNEVVLLSKGSALVSTITIMDIMGRTMEVTGRTYDYLTFYAVAGAIYLVINGLLIIGAKFVERKLMAFEAV
ncbi:ABC transporter permease subunit [Wohlfahrtiimonas chitiniclastica]|uniref:Arginine ABC transporter permease protein ArtM n=2 Tax=Wohlfahrtiimonas chitiniclastica TaxID=400946 RepID=L8Y238_9GAMM|nr:ABC transporter permease subunit [Wohlfahrtiimonas chitiniclastica]ELV09094.1 ABC-type arginine/histidine transport system, permease component [Wohlfahrtiimonas chitiniclastica SH04]KZS24153.1 ABC arginine/histidine transporter permease [Wohlfahrtiimonas chitiniclastica]KZX37744.1 amino acid ABC transporter permease [Wohlfahrtiimonas chitiniclastica]MBS7814682.1 ABC transporter permease subunit [Wohlfahrtiimonas chitiniclastica]MBS7817166.1 ABC transporter permease subunit [Wohlfahrtiimonas